MIRTIIFMCGFLSVILGFWCLALSIQNMQLEEIKERDGK